MECASGVWLKIRKLDKKKDSSWKPRSDYKDMWWFKCSNRILEDEDFYSFELQEILVWIHVLSIASQKQSDTIFLNFEAADRKSRLKKELVLSALKKLQEKHIDILENHDPNGIRTESVQNPTGSCTESEQNLCHREEKKREEKKRVEDARARTSAAQNLVPPGTIHLQLRGNSHREIVLLQVPLAVQKAWLEKYSTTSVHDTISNCVSHYLNEFGTSNVSDVPAWNVKLVRWFKAERKSLVKRPPVASPVKLPELRPLDTGPEVKPEDALENAKKFGLERFVSKVALPAYAKIKPISEKKNEEAFKEQLVGLSSEFLPRGANGTF